MESEQIENTTGLLTLKQKRRIESKKKKAVAFLDLLKNKEGQIQVPFCRT